ncbi:hypothetical protein [Mycolicibacterium sp. YH-1]|uniref:DUF7373 family lipoprotein n=1 Tax=Mycolicibacterium sp. YH-1 TaxID=2908837 RepID=UPI001F4C13C8|nr:hypothetical protein [Mycolicibacterium sp. YH-1]UNB52781.1 hypothetical protein L0M16_33965 [Mycolicibacterium sp. YH-1]
MGSDQTTRGRLAVTTTAIRTATMLACAAAMAAGCAAPTTSGNAVKAADADAAVVALMDTGTYSTVPGRPFGVTGDNVKAQHLMEAHRIAEYTVGPWEAEAALVSLPGMFDLALISPIDSVETLRDGNILPLPDVAEAHGFMTGFSSLRMAARDAPLYGLQNVVLRFPDAQSAAAAAAEMVAKAPPMQGSEPGPPTPMANSPESLAVTYELPDYIRRVDSFTAHGVFVLYQSARSDLGLFRTAPAIVDKMLTLQKKRIDEFTPTEQGAMSSLAMDPTGQLLARTLRAPDDSAPVVIGVWAPQAWLHFEQDPIATDALFNTAGVDAVTQRLTTVYQAGNADGATRIVDEFARQIGGLDDVKPIDGVPGLPSAECFEREKDWVPETQAMTYQRVRWHIKCVASADRWAYTAFSEHAADARQQMAAQYRILTGE